MSDDRTLRDELEVLGAAVKAVRVHLESTELAEAGRAKSEDDRITALRKQRDWLKQQLEELTARRTAQRTELKELSLAIDHARGSLPPPPDDTSSSLSEAPSLLKMFTDPTPGYARDQSWLGKLVARWLAATGQEWK